MFYDIVKMVLDIALAENKAQIADFFQVLRLKILLISERDVAALNNQVLLVLNRRFNDFPHNRPQIFRQGGVAAYRCQGTVSTADEPHFEVIHRQIWIVVLFQQLLRKHCFAGVRAAGDYEYNRLSNTFLNELYQPETVPVVINQPVPLHGGQFPGQRASFYVQVFGHEVPVRRDREGILLLLL